VIKINNLFNIEKGGSLLLWLFLPFLTVSILIFNLSNITDAKKICILLSLLFSYLIILFIFFLIRTFKKGGEKESSSKDNKNEPENN
jgi:predicted permease